MTQLDERALPRADFVTGVILAALGLGALILATRMPTFSERGVNPLTAPGIFPAIIGGALLLCGLILALRSIPLARLPILQKSATNARSVIIAFTLMLVAVALVGKVDFRVLAGGFTLAFMAVFLNWRDENQNRVHQILAVCVTTLLTAVLIPMLFENVFYVRLP